MSGNWTCARTDAHLDEALMGELGLLQRRAFGRHRAECAHCRAAVAEAVEVVGLLRSWPLEDPGGTFAARVLAARGAPAPAVRVPWVGYAQATVVGAVCFMVALISIVGLVWPEFREAPATQGLVALQSSAGAVESFAMLGITLVRSLGLVVWGAITVGLVGFYSAAFVGLRRFLLRRPV